jgi:hypothetical protein
MKKPDKLKSNQQRLITIMEHHEDLAYTEDAQTLYVPELAHAGLGTVVPELDLEIQALIVLTNVRVRWVGNYWQVRNRSDSQWHHIHATASFDDWQFMLCGKVK